METEEILAAIQKAAETIATPNWADIASVGLSLLAVVVAGFVAWKQIGIARSQNIISKMQTQIADKQNQIALFEKRFELYNILNSCTTSPEIVELAKDNEDILKYLFVVFGQKPVDEFDSYTARFYLENCSTKLQQSIFLFSKEIVPYILSISTTLLLLSSADMESDGQEIINKRKQDYFISIKAFESIGGLKRIRSEMNMI